MPSLTNLTRIARLGTLPETRRAIASTARSEQLRDAIHLAANDRRTLIRQLRDPRNALDFVRAAVRHPATRELGSAGMLFLPGRYLTLGWTAAWAGRRLLRRQKER